MTYFHNSKVEAGSLVRFEFSFRNNVKASGSLRLSSLGLTRAEMTEVNTLKSASMDLAKARSYKCFTHHTGSILKPVGDIDYTLIPEI